MHYYQFNIGDYAKHTGHLTMLENLAYRLMLDRYYLTEKPLESDIKKLARLLGMAGMVTEVSQVLEDFFILESDGWKHEKIEKELVEYRAKADVARANGKKGGRPRKKPIATQTKPDSNPEKTQLVNLANPEITQSQANHKPITNNHKPITNNTYTEQVSELFDFWKETMSKTSTAKLTPKRKKKIQDRLKEDYSVEDIKQAIIGCTKSPHHMGDNPQGKVYDDLELIVRDGDHVEKFIGYNKTVLGVSNATGQSITSSSSNTGARRRRQPTTQERIWDNAEGGIVI